NHFTTRLLPPKFTKHYHHLLPKITLQLPSYIQPQMIVSLSIAILLSIRYTIIPLDYTIILPSIPPLTTLLPYIPPTIPISPPIIIPLITSPFILLKLIFLSTPLHFIQPHFISP
ncbi:AI-2E family transporter, partial [Staphylococcus auricularis]|uniref:AI-2E family transporter n=1 Tax=Staphylococcus auricularis TaxID=29379 RepID=UPI001248A787